MQYNMKFFLLIAFILIKLNAEETETEQPEEQEIPPKKVLRNANSITTLKIQFYQSSASFPYFHHIKEQLENKYSDINVISEQYPLKNPRKIIYYLMLGVEGIVIILIAISSFSFVKPLLEKLLGPDFYKIVNGNKLTTIGFVVIIGLFFTQIIYNTGAFEVFCEDKLIWSTIANNGTKPTIKTIVKFLKSMK